MATTATKLCVRVGDWGDYESFDNLDEAIEYLNRLNVGKPTAWKRAGFETQNYWGNDYVSIYYGDDAYNLVDELAEYEECQLTNQLEETYL